MKGTKRRSGVPGRLALICGALAAIGLGGCGADRGPPETIVVSDSAGIRIVHLPEPREVPSTIRVSGEPVYTIGWDDQQRAFEDLRAGALLEGGAAVVVDGGRTQELVVLSPTGSIERVLGGPGQGPGEFTFISSIVVHSEGHTILVKDPQGGRISKFATDGFVESIRAGEVNLLHLHGVDPESGALMLGMPLAQVWGRRYETPFLAVPLVRLDWTTAEADTVGMADWDQSIAVGGGNNPFMSGGFISVSGGDFVVARGDRPEVRWIDPDGLVRQIVRWTAQAREVPDSLLAEWESRVRSRFEELGLPPADIDRRISSMQDAIQEPLPLIGVSGQMPGAGGLLGDPDGNVWIAEYRAPGHGPPKVYYVMSPRGEWLGAVAMPSDARVLDIGREYLLAAVRNEFDVEAAVLYRLER